MMTDWLTEGARPARPFLSLFAKKATGSSKTADEDDDDLDDDEDDDDLDDDDPDADKTDEELRAELKATREKLSKASDTAGKRRKQLREERARKAAEPKPKAPADDDKPDLDAIRAEARAEGESAALTRAKKAEAKSALLAAGVSAERVNRVVGMLDLDELDLDDDGLDGIDDAIEDLKADVPEFFSVKRKRRESVAGGADRNGDAPRGKTLTPSQRQAALVTGGARR